MTISDERRSGRLGRHELALLDILIERAREKGFGPHDVVQFPGDVLDAVTDAATQVADAVTNAATSAADAATAAAHEAAEAASHVAQAVDDAAVAVTHIAHEAADRATDAVIGREQIVFPVTTDIVNLEIGQERLTATGGLSGLAGDLGRESIAALAEQLGRLASTPAPTLGELLAVRDLARAAARKRGKGKARPASTPKRGRPG